MEATESSVYGSSLYAATAVARPDYPPLGYDIDVDVCVIGGGLAGLTTAREIARRGWSVTLLEARKLAWNASGRNTGFVLPGFAQDPWHIAERVGLPRTRELWAMSAQGLNYVRDTIAETKMEGVAPVDGWLYVSKTDQPDTMAADAAWMRDELGSDVEFWPTDAVRAKLKSERYFQAIHYPSAFHIHPLNYAFGLARAAAADGVRIFEDTPAISIDAAGVRKRIATPGARIRASHVVLAGNVHLGTLMPTISGTLLPITTFVVATAPLGERLADAMSYRGAVSDTEWADNHYRPTADNRLIWSGRMKTRPVDAARFARKLQRDIARIYPQLGEIEIAYAWNGTLGNTVHRMPQIGEVSPGLWMASGFGGHGLNTTALGGLLVARGIVDADKTWTAFNGFELIWAGGAAGRAAAKIGYWSYRAQQAFLERRSRQREKAAREAAAANSVTVPDSANTKIARRGVRKARASKG
jgi:glycine/D-amino acid oxidase-like deaminating enzyme